jgi:hypothetical protein
VLLLLSLGSTMAARAGNQAPCVPPPSCCCRDPLEAALYLRPDRLGKVGGKGGCVQEQPLLVLTTEHTCG